MAKLTVKIKEARTHFSALKGLTLVSVERYDPYFDASAQDDIARDNNEELRMTSTCGKEFVLKHKQDCCESVSIESIVGDLQDLVGSPILVAEESASEGHGESSTWTFFKLATVKGWVDIRFFGESNGYYSESAYLYVTLDATEDEFTPVVMASRIGVRHVSGECICQDNIYGIKGFPFKHEGIWIHLVKNKVVFSETECIK